MSDKNKRGSNGEPPSSHQGESLHHLNPNKFSLFILSILLPFLAVFIFSVFARGPIKVHLAPQSPTFVNDLEFESLGSNPEIQKLCKESENIFTHIADSHHCFYDKENRILGNTYFSKNMYSRQPYVSNGYIGSRISTLGQGFSYDEINIHADIEDDESVLSNGWPLFNKRYTGAFAAGFFSLQEKLPDTNFPELYANGYDSVISSLPYWANFELDLELDGIVHRFNPESVKQADVTQYHQNMSIKDGSVHTKLTWMNKVEIQVDIFAHKHVLPLGLMRLKVEPLVGDLNITIRDLLDFNTSERTTLENIGYDEDGIFMEVSPDNVPYSTAAVYSSWDIDTSSTYIVNDTKVVRELETTLEANSQLRVHKYIGIISTELDSSLAGTELDHAKDIVLHAKTQGEERLYAIHARAWENQFQETDVNIPSNGFLTLAARASLFHILSNTQHSSADLTSALGTSGLSSDSYGGMVFWDTDIWIIPGVLPFAPEVAKALSQYRNYTHGQAIENARKYGYDGGAAAYPWTSGRFGNCTSAGPCVDYEYHINVDVAFASWAIYLAGESEEYLRYTTWPLLRDAANFFSQYVEFNQTLGKYVTHNLTDPDEYANHVDNGAFTNDGIDKLLKKAIIAAKHLKEEINPEWLKIQGNIHVPKSLHNITLEYSGMNSSVSIKQADVVLLTFPLDYSDELKDERSMTQSTRDLYYYSLKQADIGPAMTFPIFSIASARLLNSGCSSQSYLLKSVLPYIRAPFAQFSEQADDNVLTNGGTNPAFPFLTAAGGYLQSLIYGVLGVKYAEKFDNEKQKIQRMLKFDPVRLQALPGGIYISGVKYLNQRLDIKITDDEGIIKHRGDKPILIDVVERNPKAGEHWLKPGTSLVVPNFIPDQNIEGSLCECQRIANLTAGSPGEVALSAIDGNNYTFWRARFRDSPGRLLIDLGSVKTFTEGMIVWGNRPAKTVSLYATAPNYNAEFDEVYLNHDQLELVKILDEYPVVLSSPWVEAETEEVKLLPQNETIFKRGEEFGNGVTARYIVLEINDALDASGDYGGTINEFAVV
ncbi:hypothetical protein WICPIJ_002094 [Wickerhamomyces pijperi]|uniref:alpha,alpha-trehalase n=1 Tax=Wickerhamomyces pijperi TaxID=599730 RepID=A0A9P8Q9S0_WICPI|nr:hypothetical protein WICPIJ_002094 [Wickerhamomyces pijperi]